MRQRLRSCPLGSRPAAGDTQAATWAVTFEHEVIRYRRAVTTGPSTRWRSSAWGVRTGSQNRNPVSGAPTSFVAPLIFLSLHQASRGLPYRALARRTPWCDEPFSVTLLANFSASRSLSDFHHGLRCSGFGQSRVVSGRGPCARSGRWPGSAWRRPRRAGRACAPGAGRPRAVRRSARRPRAAARHPASGRAASAA